MKKLTLVFLLLLGANLFSSHSIELNSPFVPQDDTTFILVPDNFHSNVNKMITSLITRYHYKKTKINDSLSSLIFDSYLKALDASRMYFLAEDIKKFEVHREDFDNFILEGNLQTVFDIFNTFKVRVNERTKAIKEILQNEFDYTIDEEYEFKRDKAPWAANKQDSDELWRKRLKNDALTRKLSGSTWSEISSSLTKRYEAIRRNVNQFKAEDVFQTFMNAFAENIDPHTNYFSPITSENFNISMSLSLEGIGAQLQTEDEYTKVVEVIPGGPAFKSGLLKAEDKIIGVGQGEDGEMVDVVGWRINDVVQLIRGPKGTKVRLQIISAAEGVSAIPKIITIVRDKVKLEEQSAKKQIIEIDNDDKTYRIGIVSIPSFYVDFEEQRKGIPDYKSTTGDVKKILDSLKREKVDGVIIDLRNNGGGSLEEAIKLTGLFIKDGPVVQVRNSDGAIDVGKDPDPELVYDGPLAVLVNRFSASASEIFSGAIQDYERGIVLGEQTFGKGTVQNLIDLNRIMTISGMKMGQVKLTIAKYYRINGGSTQNLGVIPDILFPSPIDPNEFGESAYLSALPWDQIAPTEFDQYGSIKNLIPKLVSRHEKRIQNDPEFDYLLELIEEQKIAREKTKVSLNEEVRKKEKGELEEKRFQRENERRKRLGLKLLNKDETPNANDHSQDALLNESGHILADYIALTIG